MKNKELKQWDFTAVFDERYGHLDFDCYNKQEKGWAQVFVCAEQPIPQEWRDAFLDEITSEDVGYKKMLEEDLRTFGVRWLSS